MPRLILLCLAALLFLPLSAQAFNHDYRAAGLRLTMATTDEARAKAMADMAKAASRSRAEGAELAVELLSQQSLALANDDAFQTFLSRVADPNTFSDPEAYGEAMTPLLRAMTRTMRPTLTDVNALIKLGDAIKQHDERAKAFGLPTFQDMAAKLANSGEGTVGLILNGILAAAQFAKDREAGDRMTDAATRKAQDRIISLLPDSLAPFGPALPFARDQIRWTGRQFDRSSAAIDLVTEAMETGEFDTAAYEKIRVEMMRDFRRGPWDRGTYGDALVALCKKIGPLGTFCKDIFDALAPLWEPQHCKAIDCDCANVGGGILERTWYDECKRTEDWLIEECRRTEIIPGTCHNISGPAAIPPF